MHAELKQQLKASHYLRKGLEPDLQAAAETRWRAKPVLASKPVPIAAAELVHDGPGKSLVSGENALSEEGCLLIETPTTLETKHVYNRAYAISECMIKLPSEDLTAYNRLSAYIYVEASGFHAVYMQLSIHNQGEQIMPKPGRFEGTHYSCLSPGSWHHVVWEIPYIYRDCVTGVSLGVPLLGSLPDTAKEIRVFVDRLQFESVEADHYAGFDLQQGSIAYSHSGYRSGAVKHGLIQHSRSTAFELLDVSGQTVFQAETEKLEGGFQRLDFTAFNEPGVYRLRTIDRLSEPFAIGDEAYLSAAWKTLNFFYMERCGMDVPGIHSSCHLDVRCVHPDGRSLFIAGGWHDAGDVSQSLGNTVESAYAMLELAEAVKGKQPELYVRLLEEARWGLDWVMRTRFGDGYRNVGCLIGIWTNNQLNDADDITVEAQRHMLSNFIAAGLCAKASLVFKDDEEFAARCLRIAVEDYGFATADLDQGTLITGPEAAFYAKASAAAYELYAATGQLTYRDDATAWARIVMDCQQQEVLNDFEIPLTGFFYENRSKSRILAYFHRSFEHSPMQALSRLYQAFGDHTDAPKWRRSMELYADYVKATAAMIQPYGVLPSAIYELDNSDFSGIYHEGDHSAGLPTMEEFNEQVLRGIRLSDTHYLRRFPVSFQFRGFHATLMSKAKAIAFIDQALDDRELREIAARQLEWIVGFNPFAASSMYGEGYNYHPLYVAFSDQIVGAVPVGFETFENDDEPFFPMQNAPTYKEVWVHTTCRFMWLIADLYRTS